MHKNNEQGLLKPSIEEVTGLGSVTMAGANHHDLSIRNVFSDHPVRLLSIEPPFFIHRA